MAAEKKVAPGSRVEIEEVNVHWSRGLKVIMTAWGLVILGASAVSTTFIVMDARHANKTEVEQTFHRVNGEIHLLTETVQAVQHRQQLWERQAILNSAEANMYRLQELAAQYPNNQQLSNDYARAQIRVKRLRNEYQQAADRFGSR